MICNVSREEVVDAIKIHWKLQLGCYFKSIVNLNGAMYNLGDKVVDYFWNYAGLIEANSDEDAEKLVDRIIAFAQENERVPAVYIDPTVKPNNFGELIAKRGFKLSGDEIWMFLNPTRFSTIEQPKDLHIKRVLTDEDMKVFIDIFDLSYGMGEDGKVYGESLFDAFKSGTKDVEIFHYLGMSNGIPASIASVYISSDVAGIYNVGTIPDFRKKGFGAALSRVAIAEALKHNVRKLLLQTELDSEPERLYSKIGFDQAFSGEIWSLE
jgi:GNAT superfamily N-acetyltransferase